MAVQPPAAPPAPVVPQQGTPPTAPRKSGCAGCGFGCGGCLLVIVLVFLLAIGGGWWFFVVQASAAVTAPATLVVVNQPITVGGNPGIPGQSLNPGDTVATGPGGHGGIQFPDGSYMRMSPDTTVQVTNVQLQRNGNVQAISVLQKVGRTFTNVQHLSTGATFTVGGHSVSAAVRGTQFEVLVRPNGTNLIRVFSGTVTVTGNGKTVNVGAGQEVETDANGNLSAVRPITRDPQDPYPLAAQCTNSVSGGNTAGTSQTSTGDSLATGQKTEVDYNSPGGNVTMALCYPGSSMSVSLVDPAGGVHNASGPSPVTIHAGGPPGLWRATITAVNVPGGEPYALSFATDAACEAGNVDSGGVVRETLSNSQISDALAKSGTNGVTIFVQGTSPTSAHIVYYSNVGGEQLSWTIDLYAATPKLGAVITQVSVHGINVTTQIIRNFTSYGGQSISSIPSDFIVDRVYSCAGPSGDDMVVVEGHR